MHLLEPIGEWWIDPAIFLLRNLFEIENQLINIQEMVNLLKRYKQRIINAFVSIPYSSAGFMRYLPNGLFSNPSFKGRSIIDHYECEKSYTEEFYNQIQSNDIQKKKKEIEKNHKNLIYLNHFLERKKENLEFKAVFNEKELPNDIINTLNINLIKANPDSILDKNIIRKILMKIEEYYFSEQEDRPYATFLNQEISLPRNHEDYEAFKRLIQRSEKFQQNFRQWKKSFQENLLIILFNTIPRFKNVFEEWKIFFNRYIKLDDNNSLAIRIEKFLDETIEELQLNINNHDQLYHSCWICNKVKTNEKASGRSKYPFLGSSKQVNFFKIGEEGEVVCKFCQFLSNISYFSFYNIRLPNIKQISQDIKDFYIVIRTSSQEINEQIARMTLDFFQGNELYNRYLGNRYESLFKLIESLLSGIPNELNGPAYLSFLIFSIGNKSTNVALKRIDFPNSSLDFLNALFWQNLQVIFRKDILLKNLYKDDKEIISKYFKEEFLKSSLVYSISNRMYRALLNGSHYQVLRYFLDSDKRIINKKIFKIYLVKGIKMKSKQINEVLLFADNVSELIKKETSKAKQRSIIERLERSSKFSDFLNSIKYIKKRAIINSLNPLKSITIDDILNKLLTPVSIGIPKDWRIINELIEIQVIDKISDIYKDLYTSNKEKISNGEE